MIFKLSIHFFSLAGGWWCGWVLCFDVLKDSRYVQTLTVHYSLGFMIICNTIIGQHILKLFVKSYCVIDKRLN